MPRRSEVIQFRITRADIDRMHENTADVCHFCALEEEFERTHDAALLPDMAFVIDRLERTDPLWQFYGPTYRIVYAMCSRDIDHAAGKTRHSGGAP
jgi:hypothetical protein